MATKSDELSAQGADAATGATVEAAEAISDPLGSTTSQVRRLERTGAPVNRRVGRQVRRAAERAVDTTGKLLNGSLTEKLVISGLHLVKDQARRGDLVGFAAYRSLELLHGGFGSAARSLTRFQDASQPPVRPTERRRSQTRSQARAQTRARVARNAAAPRTPRTPRTPRAASGQAGKNA